MYVLLVLCIFTYQGIKYSSFNQKCWKNALKSEKNYIFKCWLLLFGRFAVVGGLTSWPMYLLFLAATPLKIFTQSW